MVEYLAGIFDAEGYVRIRKSGKNGKFSYTPEARIYMINKEIVTLFGDKYGIAVKCENRGVNRKLAYYVTIGVKQLKSTDFIKDLLPFLNEKRLQLLEVYNLLNTSKPKLDCYNDYMLAKENFHHSINGNLSYEYIAGIIDGDGWLSTHNADSSKQSSIVSRICIGLEQRYKPMIDYLLKYKGYTHVNTIKDREHHRQTYTWTLTTSKELLFLLNKIECFLIEKRTKCQDFIKYLEKAEELNKISQELILKYKTKSDKVKTKKEKV